ncbi:hypothetical protein SDC9_158743 [bioreactor metagenome]|uniref:Uncharacterized protein n=1 Tax=bioreactor metagenome TaxID=1076179 RepID=A0A645FDC1_9ZZZZ
MLNFLFPGVSLSVLTHSIGFQQVKSQTGNCLPEFSLRNDGWNVLQVNFFCGEVCLSQEYTFLF